MVSETVRKTVGVEFGPVWNGYEELKCPHCGQFDEWGDIEINTCSCGTRVKLPQKKSHKFYYYPPKS